MSDRLPPPPFEVRLDLPGWALYWVEMALAEVDDRSLAELRADTARHARVELELSGLAAEPTTAALRRLFRAAGCDPTRYRPSSEALLRRLLKGGELPAIHPFVDLNNCLSARLRTPSCVMAEGSWRPPVTLRAGREGESYESLKGPFKLAGKPLLVDAEGPLDTPITGSRRVMIRPGAERCWLVAYLPAELVAPEQADGALRRLLDRSGGARLLGRFGCVGEPLAG